MELSNLTNTPGSRKAPKRVGRGPGSGMGHTCGKGHKGQMARKGHKRKIGHEGGQMPLFRRLPKRGFKNPTRVAYTGLNLERLDRFDDGATIDILAILRANLVKHIENGGIKILGDGAVTKKFTVKANAFSATARAKIEAAGGTCEVVQ
ncbi:MAG: 50S ribosomal protein L15 [Kiritimatiellaeota bacterium]|nr:50S ribosomal protein L15 [Kiritimatiellota bacterium]